MLAVTDPTTRPQRNLLALLVAVVATTGLLIGGCASDPTSEPALNTSVTLPEGDVAAEMPGTSYVARPVAEGDIVFRAAPSASAEVVTTLANPRPLATDPPVSIPLVLLVAEREGDWAKVYLPIRPNGSTGWIPADELTITTHPWRIEALLDEFKLKVYKNDEVVYETAIGVSRENAPTPGGLYYTTELLQPPDPNTVYGTYAYGLSGFSDTYQEFNGGPGQLGLHGTNEPWAIGTRVSSGCIRLNNEDINYIVEQLKLPLGVPVDIVTGTAPTG
jgi:lipoprotein-anchoring transpeptidase ErfK/SrfK